MLTCTTLSWWRAKNAMPRKDCILEPENIRQPQRTLTRKTSFNATDWRFRVASKNDAHARSAQFCRRNGSTCCRRAASARLCTFVYRVFILAILATDNIRELPSLHCNHLEICPQVRVRHEPMLEHNAVRQFRTISPKV